jgi:hypothetical protein
LIEKALMILIFMYAVSFSALAGQYFIGDVLDMELTNWQGAPIRSGILDFLNQDTLNEVTSDIANVNNTRNNTLDAVTQSFELGLTIGFDLLTLLTGTYIFNLMYLLLGEQSGIFIAGFVAIYAILLGRAIIAYLRGV